MRRGITVEWRDGEAPQRLQRRRKENPYNPPAALAREYASLLEEEIREGIVEEVDGREVKWLNPTFLVPKKDNKHRKILDCRELNAELQDVTFRMEGPDMVRDLIQPGDWGTSLDVKSAFSHVPVSEELRPYLAFAFKGRYYAYAGMPFGIKHAPRVFTRLMRETMRAVRERWEVRAISYMDDILLLFREAEAARRQTEEIATFLEQLGWTLAVDKCEMEPVQDITFLGWQWDLKRAEIRMTSGRRTEMKESLRMWKDRCERRQRSPIRELAGLIGNINYLRLQVRDASLHLK
jgi:hypothetical protein